MKKNSVTNTEYEITYTELKKKLGIKGDIKWIATDLLDEETLEKCIVVAINV